MIELLSTLTITQVFIFLALFFIALKELLTLYDFFKNRMDKKYSDNNNEKKQTEKILEEIKTLNQEISNLKIDYEKLNNNIDSVKKYWEKKETEYHDTLKMLVSSDKDAIKSFIVKEHHHFVEIGWIDDFSLDTIEKRYSHYVEEGGNSYVSDLMEDLRKLPNIRPKK